MRDACKLKVTWSGGYGAVAVVDGTAHTVPDLRVYYRVAGFNYSGDRGSWCELALYETDTGWTIRAVFVDEHEGGENRTVTDHVSEDRGATWRRQPGTAAIEGAPVDRYDTNTLYWRERIARSTGQLVVRGADQLSELAQHTSLRALEIIGGDFEDLRPLAGLTSLRSLKIVCAKVRDLAPLAGLTQLESLEINFTFVEDLSPIDGLELGWLALYGNPLDDRSFHEILARKRTTRIERWGRPCIVEASGESEWKKCRALFHAVPTVVWGIIPRAGASIVRPGRTGERPIDFLMVPEMSVDMILARPDPAAAPAVTNMFIQESVDQSDERFGISWLAGHALDAMRWLRDADWMPDDEKQRYVRFVERFDGEVFYREHDTIVRREVARNDTRFPAWFVQARMEALAGVRPYQREVEVRIDAFDRRAATRSGGWYSLGWAGYLNSDLRTLFRDKLGLFPIAEIVEPSELGHSVLAINLRDPEDRAIYEVDPIYAEAYVDEGGAAVTDVFSSYGALLDRITALRPSGT